MNLEIEILYIFEKNEIFYYSFKIVFVGIKERYYTLLLFMNIYQLVLWNLLCL